MEARTKTMDPAGALCESTDMTQLPTYAGIELSQEYIAIAETRIAAVITGVTVKESRNGQGALFP